jgi:Ni,Fe-hydrogenase III small subunit
MSRSDLLRFVKGVEDGEWRRMARVVWTRVARWRRWRRAGEFWRPQLYRSVPLTNAPLTHAGPESPMDPAVSVVFAVKRHGEARRSVEAFLGAAAAAGLRGFEMIGLARTPRALEELRHLSPRAPALRFFGSVKAEEREALRALFEAARAPRIVVLEPSSLDAAFLTEALERVESASDVVTGVRSRFLDKRPFPTRVLDGVRDVLARRIHGAPVRAAGATLVVRNDDRFQAAVRALRARRLVQGELLGRLAESGARIVEVSIGGRRK